MAGGGQHGSGVPAELSPQLSGRHHRRARPRTGLHRQPRPPHGLDVRGGRRGPPPRRGTRRRGRLAPASPADRGRTARRGSGELERRRTHAGGRRSCFQPNPLRLPRCGVAAARWTDGSVTVTLHHGEVVAVIDPTTGGRLTSLTVRGEEVLATVPRDVLEKHLPAGATRDVDWYRGSFPLAPWAGTLDSGAFEFDGRKYTLPKGREPVHGLVAERRWDLVGVPTKSSATFAVPIGPDLPGGWPFDGLVRQSF